MKEGKKEGSEEAWKAGASEQVQVRMMFRLLTLCPCFPRNVPLVARGQESGWFAYKPPPQASPDQH